MTTDEALREAAIEEQMQVYFAGEYMDSKVFKAEISALWDRAYLAGLAAKKNGADIE